MVWCEICRRYEEAEEQIFVIKNQLWWLFVFVFIIFLQLEKISYRMAMLSFSLSSWRTPDESFVSFQDTFFSPIESLQLYISMSIVDSSCWCEYLKSFFMFSPPWMEMNLELIRLQAERVMIQKKMWSLCITTCDFNSRGIWARGWAPDECGLYWKIIQFSNSMKTLSLLSLLLTSHPSSHSR